jgi:hypothetical protein
LKIRPTFKSRIGARLGQLPVIRRTSFCRRSNLEKTCVCCQFPEEVGSVVKDLLSNLWNAILMLAPNCSVLSWESTLVSVLKAMASILPKYSFHIIFLS